MQTVNAAPAQRFVNFFLHKLNEVNNKHYEIKNPVLRFIYTLLAQLPLNLLGMALKMIVIPLAIIIDDVNHFQLHIIANLKKAAQSKQTTNKLEEFKTRLASTLNLPVYLAIAFILRMARFPFHLAKVLNEYINSARKFFKYYSMSKETSFLVKAPSVVADIALFIIQLPLVLVTPLLEAAFRKVGVFYAIDMALTAIAFISSLAGIIAIEAMFLPYTLGMYAIYKLSKPKQNFDEVNYTESTNGSAVSQHSARTNVIELNERAATLLPSGGPVKAAQVTENSSTNDSQPTESPRRNISPASSAIRLV